HRGHDRGDVDDASGTPFAHRREERPYRVLHREHVDGHAAGKVARLAIEDRPVGDPSGAIDQHADFRMGSPERHDCLGIGHVDRNRVNPLVIAEFPGEPLLLEIGGDHPGSLAQEGPGDRKPDALPGACDQASLSDQSIHRDILQPGNNVRPPSTRSTWPLTKRLCELARKATASAISSGDAYRSSDGPPAAIRGSVGLVARKRAVMAGPGLIALTRTPEARVSAARQRV